MKSLLIISLLFGIVMNSCKTKSEKWSEWVKDNSQGIALNDTSYYEDLQFLGDILREKRIVLLGESGHGVAEYTMLKSRIIRYLHEELDFDILAFEANSADAFAADYFGSYSNVDSTIYNSISTLWHVEEIVPLFRYINATHTTDDPLLVQGVDITQSNGSYAFSKFLYYLIQPIDPLYAEEIRHKDSLFSAEGVRKYTIGETYTTDEKESFKKLRENRFKDYTHLKEYIQVNRDQFSEVSNREIEAALFYLQSRLNFIHWIDRDSSYMASITKGTRYIGVPMNKLFSVYRDYQMAQNLEFLSKTLFPDKKIIVWAQNAHIKKWPLRMAYELNEHAPTYTIALFCYSGEGDSTFGQAFDGSHPDSMVYKFITPQDPLSIAQLLHPSGHEITLIDMENQIKSEGNSWMFDMAKAHDWDGSGLEELENIRNVWDALILVNKTRTPKYLEYEYDYLGQGTKGYNKR